MWKEIVGVVVTLWLFGGFHIEESTPSKRGAIREQGVDLFEKERGATAGDVLAGSETWTDNKKDTQTKTLNSYTKGYNGGHLTGESLQNDWGLKKQPGSHRENLDRWFDFFSNE